jgi:flagellar hook-associated protein 2
VSEVTSGAITLTAGTYNSAADLVDELQTQIDADATLQGAERSLTVSHNGTAFVFTAESYGSDSTVRFVSVDTNTEAELGFSPGVGTRTDGLDVAGTIGGATATGSGQTLTGSGDAAGLSISITGGAIGARGTIDFTRGITDRLDTLLDSILDSEGIFSSRIESLNSRVDDINDQRDALELRMEALEARYLRQFSAMDALVAQLQSTSNFLFQQLGNTPFAQQNG